MLIYYVRLVDKLKWRRRLDWYGKIECRFPGKKKKKRFEHANMVIYYPRLVDRLKKGGDIQVERFKDTSIIRG